MGDDRRPWSRGHRRPRRPRERAGARARRAGQARALAGARGRPGDVNCGVQGPAAWLCAGPARGRQPRPAGGRPGARAGVRDRHGLRRARDGARLHSPPRHDRGRPGNAHRGGRRHRGANWRRPQVASANDRQTPAVTNHRPSRKLAEVASAVLLLQASGRRKSSRSSVPARAPGQQFGRGSRGRSLGGRIAMPVSTTRRKPSR